MNDKGFPSPNGQGWTGQVLAAMLANPIYCGTGRWAATSRGKYHSVEGGEIVAVNYNGNGLSRGQGPSRRKRRSYTRTPSPALSRSSSSRKSSRGWRLGDTGKAETMPSTCYPASSSASTVGSPCMEHSDSTRAGSTVMSATFASGTRNGDRTRSGTRLAAIIPWLRICYSASWSASSRRSTWGPGRAGLVADIKAELQGAGQGGQRRPGAAGEAAGRVGWGGRPTGQGDPARPTPPELVQELNEPGPERQSIQDGLQRAGRFQAVEDVDQVGGAASRRPVGHGGAIGRRRSGGTAGDPDSGGIED